MPRAALAGRVAVITGASSGIGRATALEFARRGARLALAARRPGELERVADEARDLGADAVAIPTDVTQRDAVSAMVRTAAAHYGRIDVLVANAGQYVRAPATEITVELLERSLAVNFYGAACAVLEVLPTMLAQHSGHLVLVSSLDGVKGLPGDGPYVVAKFALRGLGDVLRQELGRQGIGVTTVLPGRVDTPMIDWLASPWLSPKVPPEVVARHIARAVERDAAEVVVPARALLLRWVQALSPRLADWGVRVTHLTGWQVGTERRPWRGPDVDNLCED